MTGLDWVVIYMEYHPVRSGAALQVFRCESPLTDGRGGGANKSRDVSFPCEVFAPLTKHVLANADIHMASQVAFVVG